MAKATIGFSSHQMETRSKRRRKLTNMNRDLFTYLPSEIMIEIFIRTSVQTIQMCKYVCKSWQNLISTNEFAKFHLSKSKSVPGLALIVLSELKAEDKLPNVLDLNFISITKFYSTCYTHIQGSVDGLLLLGMPSENRLHLCNPVTRECIDLNHVHSQSFDLSKSGVIIYGFGVSKITGQYKSVAIFLNYSRSSEIIVESECKVYTVGTGLWRSVNPPHGLLVCYTTMSYIGAFVNGKLHWLVNDKNGTPWILCFDLETELFSTICPPNRISIDALLVDVDGRLCICDYTCKEDMDIVIWLMEEYSWRKKFVIENSSDFKLLCVCPIRVSEDGVILLGHDNNSVFYFCSKNKSKYTICNSGEGERGCACVASHSYIPSFLSLKCFTMENLFSF